MTSSVLTIPPGLAEARRAALERFHTLGFPTTKNEDWKYTNLAPFLKTPFEAAPVVKAAEVRERIEASLFADLECPRLVFVNGRYAAELSTPPEGVEALDPTAFSDAGDNALAAWNTAMFEDGALIRVKDGVALAAPIHVLHVVAGGGVSYPRIAVVVGREAQTTIVEQYLGLDETRSFTVAVTDVTVGDGATVSYTKLQVESAAALHYGVLRVKQGASSNFTSNSLALGAGLARNEIAAVLAGEGADATLNGLYLTTGRQHVDNHTTLDHAQPHTTSREVYKGILDGKSEGVFHGRIIVRPEAQKTDAIQRNKNLLLSRDAVVNTKPQLEIYADDVRCTHGATVGQVDPDAVFYLQSRGIGLEEARSLLTYAFTSDVIDAIGVEAVRARLAGALFERLSKRTEE